MNEGFAKRFAWGSFVSGLVVAFIISMVEFFLFISSTFMLNFGSAPEVLLFTAAVLLPYFLVGYAVWRHDRMSEVKPSEKHSFEFIFGEIIWLILAALLFVFLLAGSII